MSKSHQKRQQCLPLSCLLCEGGPTIRPEAPHLHQKSPFRFLNASTLKQTSSSHYTKWCWWSPQLSPLFFYRTAQITESIQYWAARSGRAWIGFNKAGKVFTPSWRKVRRHQAISFAHHVQLGLALSKEASVANCSRIDMEEVHTSSMQRGKQAWVDVNSFWLVWNWSCEAPAYHSG